MAAPSGESAGKVPDGLPRGLKTKLVAHAGPVAVAKWSGDGRYCLSGGMDRTIRLWNPFKADPKTGALLVHTYSGPHGKSVQDIVITADNSRFASSGGDRLVFYWDVSGCKVLRKYQGHVSDVSCVAFNADGSLLLSGSKDTTVRIWDCKAHNFKPIQILTDMKDSVTGLVCTDSEILVSSVDGCIYTYDIRAGKMSVDNLHSGPITSLALSGDGNCALAMCMNKGGRLKLLDRTRGELLNTYTGHRHSEYPLRACFSNDDAHVLSGSEDGVVRFWDLVEAKEVHRLTGHSRPVSSVAFHPDATMLLTASFDGKVGVWQ